MAAPWQDGAIAHEGHQAHGRQGIAQGLIWHITCTQLFTACLWIEQDTIKGTAASSVANG